ncbi:MAG: hypothetical protein WA211_15035 [Candidatus Acidiferrales bacterium]|jgi:hypothetical protein
MYFRTTIVLAAALAMCADLSDVNRYRTPLLPGELDLGTLPNTGALPEIYLSVVQQSSGKAEPLQPQSRLEIVRYVSGEFAKARKPIPSGKKGFKIEVGKQVDDNDLRNALRSHGPAASPGDTVQVTGIEFRAKEIVVEINGGGKSHFNIRDHIQIGMGGGGMDPLPVSSAAQRPTGGTLILDFGKQVPDMSADDLMTDLQAFLDFSKEHSGAVNWIDTLPPQFKQAITDHEALVGMNHEMVLAALGRPEHKVRERDPDGTETEDWIYGTPPARTTFVTFTGDKVIRVKEFD